MDQLAAEAAAVRGEKGEVYKILEGVRGKYRKTQEGL
jgi:hypothetical protein